jgi:hypothetical protein
MVNLPISARRLNNEYPRHIARIFQMVTELHKIGYQGLRVWPQVHHDRFHLVPSIFTTHRNAHGVMMDWSWVMKPNSSHSESTAILTVYYGHEMARKTARESADLFVRRFPLICALSFVEDYEYAGWFERLTGEVERGLRPRLGRLSGSDLLDSDLFEIDKNSFGPANNNNHDTPPTLFLMKEGDKRDARNIVRTFPLPPLPKLDGNDLHLLVGELLGLIR